MKYILVMRIFLGFWLLDDSTFTRSPWPGSTIAVRGLKELLSRTRASRLIVNRKKDRNAGHTHHHHHHHHQHHQHLHDLTLWSRIYMMNHTKGGWHKIDSWGKKKDSWLVARRLEASCSAILDYGRRHVVFFAGHGSGSGSDRSITVIYSALWFIWL